MFPIKAVLSSLFSLPGKQEDIITVGIELMPARINDDLKNLRRVKLIYNTNWLEPPKNSDFKPYCYISVNVVYITVRYAPAAGDTFVIESLTNTKTTNTNKKPKR